MVTVTETETVAMTAVERARSERVRREFADIGDVVDVEGILGSKRERLVFDRRRRRRAGSLICR